jgi:[ribosomal protein S5]-alanine N-acetyltransferase
VASGLREGTECRLVGFLADGRIAGLFNLTQIFRRALQGAFAGWSVNAEVARQGYATEGVIALLDLAFAAEPAGLGLHRVQANIVPTNVPSLRVAEKAGFRREGLALRYLKIAGEWRDHAMYAKLADEHTPLYLLSRAFA